jgi:predicted RNase H-like HicB family nuclease
MNGPQRYLVVFEHTDGAGHNARVPDLPGCVAAAESREECEQLIREAAGGNSAGARPGHRPR